VSTAPARPRSSGRAVERVRPPTRRPAASRRGPRLDPRTLEFYDRPVHDVARDLIGCTVRHGDTAGRIVETESYHEIEPACHAYAGLTDRTRHLFGPPGIAYVYRSYGTHALLNAVAEPDGVGAAALIRALEPLEGIELMRARRGLDRPEDLCSGPGKLTAALGIWLDLNGTSLCGEGPIDVLPPDGTARRPAVVSGVRIGINKAADLPWRFCDATSRHVSRPWPREMRQLRGA
jgi:DNA-3-methyladenine glycosylase